MIQLNSDVFFFRFIGHTWVFLVKIRCNSVVLLLNRSVVLFLKNLQNRFYVTQGFPLRWKTCFPLKPKILKINPCWLHPLLPSIAKKMSPPCPFSDHSPHIAKKVNSNNFRQILSKNFNPLKGSYKVKTFLLSYLPRIMSSYTTSFARNAPI